MITADDIADLARNLVTDTAKEVRVRCGVSRAYYAAFHYCKTAANTWCHPLPETDKKDRGEHAQLYYQLKNHGKDASKETHLRIMAAEAGKLKDLRVESDYCLSATVDQKTFARSLHIMNQVKNSLDSLKQTSQ